MNILIHRLLLRNALNSVNRDLFITRASYSFKLGFLTRSISRLGETVCSYLKQLTDWYLRYLKLASKTFRQAHMFKGVYGIKPAQLSPNRAKELCHNLVFIVTISEGGTERFYHHSK